MLSPNLKPCKDRALYRIDWRGGLVLGALANRVCPDGRHS